MYATCSAFVQNVLPNNIVKYISPLNYRIATFKRFKPFLLFPKYYLGQCWLSPLRLRDDLPRQQLFIEKVESEA